jgi:hypothetical protein
VKVDKAQADVDCGKHWVDAVEQIFENPNWKIR